MNLLANPVLSKIFLKEDSEFQLATAHCDREGKTLGIYLKPFPSSSHL